jgi:phosphate transport system substrate-binding protein
MKYMINFRAGYVSLFTLCCMACIAFVFSCKKEAGNTTANETMVAGKTTILVDNTIQPIVEDILAVYHHVYDRATISQVNKSESEIVKLLLDGSAAVAVLPRKLTAQEEASFKSKNMRADATEIGTDAIALIANKRAADTVVNLEEIIKVLQGKPSAKVKQLVFDDAGSSTIQHLLKVAGVASVPASNVYALKSNEEVIKFVHDNNGAIGVIGLNWVVQAPQSLTKYVENVQVLGVDNVKKDKTAKVYYKPSQSNIATGSYPLTRKLYVLNYQGKIGLGMGFATFASAPEGQRIILKSGLLPVTIPVREMEVRNEL